MTTKTGAPWIKLIGNKSLDNDLSKTGAPYCIGGIEAPIIVITGNIKAILKVTTPHINRFLGVDMAQVEG